MDQTDPRNIVRDVGFVSPRPPATASITYVISYLKIGFATGDADRAIHRLGDQHHRHHGLDLLTDEIDQRTVYLYACAFRGALRCVDVPAQ